MCPTRQPLGGSQVDSRQRLQAIHDGLVRGLAAVHVEIIDDSADHVGHPGAASGAGHYRVLVVSPRFDGLSRLAAHRLVYQALGSLLVEDIHALQIRTLTPAQWSSS